MIKEVVIENGLVSIVFKMNSKTLLEQYSIMGGTRSIRLAESIQDQNSTTYLMADEALKGEYSNKLMKYSNIKQALFGEDVNQNAEAPLEKVGDLAQERPFQIIDNKVNKGKKQSSAVFYLRSSKGDELERIITLNEHETWVKITNNLRLNQSISL